MNKRSLSFISPYSRLSSFHDLAAPRRGVFTVEGKLIAPLWEPAWMLPSNYNLILHLCREESFYPTFENFYEKITIDKKIR